MSATLYAEQLSAMLDGQLPPGKMAALTAHLATCPDCAAYIAELAGLRAALQEAIPEEDVSPDFYAQISRLLEPKPMPAPRVAGPNVIAFRPHAVRRNAGWIAAATAVAAMLMLLLLPHEDKTPDLMSVRDAALRGGISQTMAANIAAPVVAGFQLASARADIVAGHPARVLAYSRANQTVTLCIWPANGEPAHGVRDAVYRGMTIRYWNDGTQEYWAATNGSAATLDAFVNALQGA